MNRPRAEAEAGEAGPGACRICGGPLPRRARGGLCCAGCAAVDALLREGSGGGAPPPPREPRDFRHTTLLALRGDPCLACAVLAERALGEMPGIGAARLDRASGILRIAHDPERAPVREIVRALGRAGLAAEPGGDPVGRARARQREVLIRLGVAAFFAGPAMLLTLMLDLGASGSAHRAAISALAAAVAAPSLAASAPPLLAGALRALRAGRATPDLLAALGIVAAVALSAFELFLGRAPFLDAAAILGAGRLAGRALDGHVRLRAAEATAGLARAEAGQARRELPSGGEERVPAGLVRPGEVVRVGPGEGIPVDGTVVDGTSEVDDAPITGEPLPRPVGPGSPVLAGQANGGGAIRIRCSRSGAETAAAALQRAVEGALAARGRIASLGDRAMALVVPLALALSAGAAGVAVGAGLSGIEAGRRAAAVLLVCCPCALALAAPAAVAAGLGRAARLGALLRDGAALERLARVERVVLDKTGTLTAGRPEVVGAVAAGREDRALALALAAAASAGVAHPLSRALERSRSAVAAPPLGGVRALPGRGIEALAASGERVRIGSEAWLGAEGVRPSGPLSAAARASAARGETPVLVAVGGRVLAAVRLRDRPRPEAARAVRALKAMGLRVALLSGDRPEAVLRTAREAGIAEAEGGLLPGAKAERVRAWRARGERLLYVGDGMNDAAPLAGADASLAVGDASAAALAAADGILPSGDLLGLVALVRLARKVRRAVLANLLLGVAFNALALPLAAAGALHPAVAAAAMAASSLAVLGNALRLGLGGGGG